MTSNLVGLELEYFKGERLTPVLIGIVVSNEKRLPKRFLKASSHRFKAAAKDMIF